MSLPEYEVKEDIGSLGGNVFIPNGLLQTVQGPYNYSHRHSDTYGEPQEYTDKTFVQHTRSGTSIQPVQLEQTNSVDFASRRSLQVDVERPDLVASHRAQRSNTFDGVRHSNRRQRVQRTKSQTARGFSDPLTCTRCRTEPVISYIPATNDISNDNIRRNASRDRQISARRSYAPGIEVLNVRKLSNRHTTTPITTQENPSGEAFLQKNQPLDRSSTVRRAYENAKSRQQQMQRSKSFQSCFRYSCYLLLAAFVYFVLVGRPLWGGTVWYLYLLFEYHLTFVGGSAIFIGLAFFYAFGPLLILFERPAPSIVGSSVDGSRDCEASRQCDSSLQAESPGVSTPPATGTLPTDTALLIPCYKSARLLPDTLEAALKVFPATSIFILANGNSPVPLDDTEQVCNRFGVNHVWIPVGSKIVAQYVGSYVARVFPYVLLIDDDCLLPSNFPIVTERLRGRVKCLGYTLTSIGENRSRGTWAQQAQDLEYKLSGLQRLFAGKIGSATFPHGAIVLWDTEFLIRTFKQHPGYSVSEDWFFGHVARELGSRITMCTSVFVETETPNSVFFASGGSRGGFGEMTIFKQRFKRWNFFFVNGMWYNLVYILCSWQLGWWEVGAKFFVFQEVYETALYLITPIVLPISFVVRPVYTSYLFAATLGLYMLNALIFNEVHLRRSGKMVNRGMLLFYYMPFKFILTFVNVASCWWSLWQYAKYFAKRHPRIVEDEKAVGVVLKIEEDRQVEQKLGPREENISQDRYSEGEPQLLVRGDNSYNRPRRMTVTAVRVDIDPLERITSHTSGQHEMYIGPLDTPVHVLPSSTGVESVTAGWISDWTLERGARSDALTAGRPTLGVVAEAEIEDQSTTGYSYYGI